MGSGSAPRQARPLGVTVMVVVITVAALIDVAAGVVLLIASTDADILSDADITATVARLAGGIAIAVGAVMLALAVGLLRGHNAARLLLSLTMIVHIGYAFYLISQFDSVSLLHGVSALLAGFAALTLLWTKSANVFFEGRQERALADSLAPREQSRSARLAAIGRNYLGQLVLLSITVALTPSIVAESAASLLLAVAIMSLAARALQPVLARAAGLFGWLGAMALALFSNAAFMGIGLGLTPGIELTSIPGLILASWLYALLMTLFTWAFSINTQNYLMLHAARMSGRRGKVETSDTPGVIFVQLDGVPAPVLEFQIQSGNLPTIGRWIRNGSHSWTEWVARVPSTTPVSQAGLLHGDNEDIPAFRWYEKDEGRLVVANHPPDAALIESRISDGRGLLADEGVSISNLFSGDAPTSMLTMSGLRQGKGQGLGPSKSYAAFFTHPAGFFRAVILTIGEMAKEIFQARRQEHRDIQPRISRKGSYVLLRAATNVFIRDLNVALIVESMMAGAKSIYVDFVDYDEIAHHAGVTRPESLDSLLGLDTMLASLETLAKSGSTPRPYRIVLVSDHGQSQGATFRQRYGKSLEELVSSYIDAPVTAATHEVEGWGPVNVFLNELSGQGSVSGRLTKRAFGDESKPLGPSDAEHAAAEGDEEGKRPHLVVVGSGNLGGIWFADCPGRLRLSEIEAMHPALIQRLADHPGIGFLVVMTAKGPLAIGPEGTHLLTDGTVTGVDPIAAFGPDARADFLRAANFDHAPDIYVNSLHDPNLDEVAAFEELVGCHGGLGGWQTRPLLVYPSDWSLAPDLLDDRGRLYGADMVHQQMVRWLEELGHRQDLAPATPNPTSEASGV